jgi:hypothetical protein
VRASWLALVLVVSAVAVPAVVAAQAPSGATQGLPPAEQRAAYPWNKRVGSAGRFARSRRGRVSWAVVSPDGRVRGSHVHRRHPSASVVKAMLLVAYLRRVPDRGLTGREQALLRPMIISSRNGAATRVHRIVGARGLERLARRARMRDFAAAGGSWSRTEIAPFDQARFFFRIDSFVPRRHRAYARELLAGIVRPQRWGVPPATPHGWRIFFKGGWVPPHRVNQVALLERDRSRIAIAVLNQGTPSQRYGEQTIEGVARRLLLRVNRFRP